VKNYFQNPFSTHLSLKKKALDTNCWFFNKEIKKITKKDFERKNTAVLSKGIILLIIQRLAFIDIIPN